MTRDRETEGEKAEGGKGRGTEGGPRRTEARAVRDSDGAHPIANIRIIREVNPRTASTDKTKLFQQPPTEFLQPHDATPRPEYLNEKPTEKNTGCNPRVERESNPGDEREEGHGDPEPLGEGGGFFRDPRPRGRPG